MLPRTATPKNDVLVGWPRERGHDVDFHAETESETATATATATATSEDGGGGSGGQQQERSSGGRNGRVDGRADGRDAVAAALADECAEEEEGSGFPNSGSEGDAEKTHLEQSEPWAQTQQQQPHMQRALRLLEPRLFGAPSADTGAMTMTGAAPEKEKE